MRRAHLARTGVPRIPAPDGAGDAGSSVGVCFEGGRTEWEDRDTPVSGWGRRGCVSQGEIASATKNVTRVSVSSFPPLWDWRRPVDRFTGLKATLALVTIESPGPLFLPPVHSM